MEAPKIRRCEARTVIAMRHQGSYDEIGKVYGALSDWARRHGAKVVGRGLTIFLSPPKEFDSATALFEVCLPVETAPKADRDVVVKTLPACSAAVVRVKGPYSKIPAHYSEMLAWLSAEGREIIGPPREAYIIHPNDAGGDPNEFVTEIQFPVSE